VARAQAYLRAKFHLDSSNRLATVHQHHRQTDRTGQDNGQIALGKPFYKRSPKNTYFSSPGEPEQTRHRASTSMYSLTFRVRFTTPPQYGRHGTAHAAGTLTLSLARGVFAGMRSAWHCVRRVVGLADYRWALPRISSVTTSTQPVHRLQTRPIVHN